MIPGWLVSKLIVMEEVNEKVENLNVEEYILQDVFCN